MSVAHAESQTIELDASRQFDFWLGEWDCTWHADGLEHPGTNSAYSDLGGMVVVESRDGRPSLDFAANGLDWSHARSDDGGETWAALWEIGYTRVV